MEIPTNGTAISPVTQQRRSLMDEPFDEPSVHLANVIYGNLPKDLATLDGHDPVSLIAATT